MSARTTRRSTARIRTRRSRQSPLASIPTTRARVPRRTSARFSSRSPERRSRPGGPTVGRSGLEAYGTLLLRIFLGFIYLAHAYLAVYKMGFPSGVIAYQRSVGVPLPELGAWYLLLAHGLGGILLILGILVRWAALANIPVMAGALWFVHASQGFFIFAGKNGYEYPLFVLGATVAQILLGPGAFTLKK